MKSPENKPFDMKCVQICRSFITYFNNNNKTNNDNMPNKYVHGLKV
jgi:hypothetical protein